MGELINNAFKFRQVESTPNNPDSSRSHVLCLLKLKKKPDDKGIVEYRNIIICDFAGVENKFQCNNLQEILNFDLRYSESNKYNKQPLSYDEYFCSQEAPKDAETVRKFSVDFEPYRKEEVVKKTNAEVDQFSNLYKFL
jgi:hypothetical protein